ncbi:MAG TPA: FAD:protein FMN transferase [Chitinophagales bacterium]|nr:FAD:protein FMN transferase [Chitinophagales bacterium]
MTKNLSLLLIFALLFSCAEMTHSQTVRKRNTVLMGSEFDITIVAKDSLSAENYIDQAIAEIARIENLISDWKSTSQVSEVNQNAGIRPVKVDLEVFKLTQRAIEFSKITDGAFDISFAAMDKIWKFDGSMTSLPDEATLSKAIEKVGYQNIILDSVEMTVFLKLPGMKIGFGATGKSYAADKAKALMIVHNVEAGIINASGDITTWGNPPNGHPWKIGINHPFKLYKSADILKIKNGAIVTSGDYQKYAEINGKRYSHIINPTTGMPSTELTSVTVIGKNAETANAFSTAIMVIGKKGGLQLLKKSPDFAGLIINNSGKIIKSKNYKKIKCSLSSN